MMISKGLLVIAIIIPIILGILFIASNIPDNQDASIDNRINIQLVREEMQLVSFGVTENVGSERRDILFVDDDGSILFSPELGQGEPERNKISINDLKIIKSFITDSGILLIEEGEFLPNSLPEKFVRYTLTINIDNTSKRFQWVENKDEFEPSNAPPLLIRLKDMIYCMTGKAELYAIKCS